MKKTLPMNLQLFAEAAAPAQAAGSEQAAQGAAQQGQTQPQASGSTPVQIDYGKIQQMLNGTLAAKEDTALKAYFKQQGLTEEEMQQAIKDFKAQKAKNQPDIPGLQAQISKAEAVARQYLLESKATMAALQLGLDAKTIPYVIKMADMSKVIGTDGNVDETALQAALNQVLTDIPQLKPQAQTQQGFMQVGAVVNPQTSAPASNGQQKAVASKPWNRVNH